MNWKRWKLGILVASLTGLCSAMVAWGAADKISIKGLLLVLGVNVGQNVLLFLKQHPVDDLADSSPSAFVKLANPIPPLPPTPPAPPKP